MKNKIRFPRAPKHPERICWGCDKFCATREMFCGNGSDRSQHPMELLGEDSYDYLTEEDKAKIDIV